MVKSETCRDAEILVRNPSPRLFGKKFQDSKKVKTNHAKTRFRNLSKTLPRFRDPAKIFRDPRFSRYHSPPLRFIHCKNKRISVLSVTKTFSQTSTIYSSHYCIQLQGSLKIIFSFSFASFPYKAYKIIHHPITSRKICYLLRF